MRCNTARVQVPNADRGTGDFRNIQITFLEVTDVGLYKLGNECGTVEEVFSRNLFSVCQEILHDFENISPVRKSLWQPSNE